jgi:hypothetical protein
MLSSEEVLAHACGVATFHVEAFFKAGAAGEM